MRILVVEDDRRMAGLLQRSLEEEGHVVTVTGDGNDALSLAAPAAFDLLVLDVMLPGLDGFGVAHALRRGGNQVPILMLTARDANRDVVHGLDLGADDYLTKPFALDVLLARVRAAGRRGPASQAVRFEVGDLVLDQGGREVARGGRVIPLTRTEYLILELLMRNAGRVVTRESLIESVWGGDSDIESNTLDAFVRLLRGKIEAAGMPKLIHTARGFGYTVKVDEG